MSISSRRRLLVTGSALLLALSSTVAFAHHGWTWAEAGMIELTGNIVSVTIAPPHPIIEVDAEGEIWTVELGNPAGTQRAGFVEGSAAPGQEIVVLGNRDSAGGLRMKAVRVTVDGEVFDIYPERIPQ